jgi:hypothetical protein
LWTKTADTAYEASGDAFHYLIHELRDSFVATAWSRGDGTIDVKVAQAVEPTLDDAKRATQLWEFDGQMRKKRAERVRVYFRGYVEYHVDDTVKVEDAVGFGEAAGTFEDRTPGSLIQHTVNGFKKELFAIEGADVESLQLSASLQPSVEGPIPI